MSVVYAGRHGWKVDVDIWHAGGVHRLGASYRSLWAALKQAEAQVPGSTIPLHSPVVGSDDRQSCVAPGCGHFRVAHGRDYCRQPGCDCSGFTYSRHHARSAVQS